MFPSHSQFIGYVSQQERMKRHKEWKKHINVSDENKFKILREEEEEEVDLNEARELEAIKENAIREALVESKNEKKVTPEQSKSNSERRVKSTLDSLEKKCNKSSYPGFITEKAQKKEFIFPRKKASPFIQKEYSQPDTAKIPRSIRHISDLLQTNFDSQTPKLPYLDYSQFYLSKEIMQKANVKENSKKNNFSVSPPKKTSFSILKKARNQQKIINRNFSSPLTEPINLKKARGSETTISAEKSTKVYSGGDEILEKSSLSPDSMNTSLPHSLKKFLPSPRICTDLSFKDKINFLKKDYSLMLKNKLQSKQLPDYHNSSQSDSSLLFLNSYLSGH